MREPRKEKITEASTVKPLAVNSLALAEMRTRTIATQKPSLLSFSCQLEPCSASELRSSMYYKQLKTQGIDLVNAEELAKSFGLQPRMMNELASASKTEVSEKSYVESFKSLIQERPNTPGMKRRHIGPSIARSSLREALSLTSLPGRMTQAQIKHADQVLVPPGSAEKSGERSARVLTSAVKDPIRHSSTSNRAFRASVSAIVLNQNSNVNISIASKAKPSSLLESSRRVLLKTQRVGAKTRPIVNGAANPVSTGTKTSPSVKTVLRPKVPASHCDTTCASTELADAQSTSSVVHSDWNSKKELPKQQRTSSKSQRVKTNGVKSSDCDSSSKANGLTTTIKLTSATEDVRSDVIGMYDCFSDGVNVGTSQLSREDLKEASKESIQVVQEECPKAHIVPTMIGPKPLRSVSSELSEIQAKAMLVKQMVKPLVMEEDGIQTYIGSNSNIVTPKVLKKLFGKDQATVIKRQHQLKSRKEGRSFRNREVPTEPTGSDPESLNASKMKIDRKDSKSTNTNHVTGPQTDESKDLAKDLKVGSGSKVVNAKPRNLNKLETTLKKCLRKQIKLEDKVKVLMNFMHKQNKEPDMSVNEDYLRCLQSLSEAQEEVFRCQLIIRSLEAKKLQSSKKDPPLKKN